MKSSKDVPVNYDMLVFCHLRWEFMYHRPQHLISRLAQNRRVLFIEEPLSFSPGEENSARLIKVSENLHVLQPKVASVEAIKNIIDRYIADRHIETGWFYSPVFEVLLPEFSFDKIVYDCMDEPSLFKEAPGILVAQEKKLLEQADLVFTGGRSLYEAKSKEHPHVYLFQDAVEQEHFSKSQNGIPLPEDLLHIPQPIAGYYGVIDERIDLKLLQEVAVSNPLVSFVLIGPVLHIAEDALPHAPNIYYLGPKPYQQLPNYLKAFRVALLPFVMNDSTRYLSPAKAFEYMAGNKPIISTAVYDVVRDYSPYVQIVSGVTSFSEALEKMVNAKKSTAPGFHFEEVLKNKSWDSTAQEIEQLLFQQS